MIFRESINEPGFSDYVDLPQQYIVRSEQSYHDIIEEFGEARIDLDFSQEYDCHKGYIFYYMYISFDKEEIEEEEDEVMED